MMDFRLCVSRVGQQDKELWKNKNRFKIYGYEPKC